MTTSYSIAHFALGHTSPALACTVALSSLSLNRDARPKRVAETATAMVLGITLSVTVLVVLGRGATQIGVTLVLVLVLATQCSRSPAFALSAATQSMLVAVLPDVDGGPYLRVVDGFVGGVVALVTVALLPRAPLTRALRAGELVAHEIATCAHLTAQALETGDASLARDVVERLRKADASIEAWGVTVESARAVAAFSPLSRRNRSQWIVRLQMQRGLERVAEDLRMVARRASVITRTGRPQPRAARVASEIAAGLDALSTAHSRPGVRDGANRFRKAAGLIGEIAGHSAVDQGIVAMMRQVIVDCEIAAGATESDARSALPQAYVPTTTSPLRLSSDLAN